MDNYILADSQEPVVGIPVVGTPRRFQKVGFVGILFVGCGFLWQATVTTFNKAAGIPHKITGDYTDDDLVKIFGQDGPKPEHVFRPQNLVAAHGPVDVDTDVNAHAIYQGDLGDCYFDAALAAIAHRHPDSITGMFVHIDMRNRYFRTRWFMGGRWVLVAVNADIPVDPNRNKPFFLWSSSELALWPAILEKSYAKLVGNYKGIESGDPGEAMQYLLGVPVNMIQDFSGTWSNIQGARDLNDVWNQIVHAVNNHYPIAIGTSRGGYHGIAGGHAYTLYGYSNNHQGHGRSVRVRNPWGDNHYAGTITGQSNTIGDFWITWDEFTRNYVDVRIALLRPGYEVQQLSSVPVSGQRVSGRVTFTVGHNQPFSLQALYPPSRMTTAAHCPDIHVPMYICSNPHSCPTRLLLTRSGSTAAQVGSSTINGLRVDGQGAGTWVAELFVNQGSFGGLPEISMSAHVPGAGGLLLAETPVLSSTLPVSTLGVQLVSTEESLPKAASLQPIETPSCSDYYSRLIHGMNGIVLPTDAQFPDSLASIASVGTNCGDAAHGFRESCANYNHWQNMVDIANTETDDLSCFDFTRQGNVCQVWNRHCNRPAILFCRIVGCDIAESPLQPRYGFTHLDGACCGCNDPSNFR